MGILFYHEFFTIADIYAWGCRLAVELTSYSLKPNLYVRCLTDTMIPLPYPLMLTLNDLKTQKDALVVYQGVFLWCVT